MRFVITIGVVLSCALLIANAAFADRFTLEKDIVKSISNISKLTDKAIEDIASGKKIDSELKLMQKEFETLSAMDMILKSRQDSQLAKLDKLGSIAVGRQKEFNDVFNKKYSELLKTLSGVLNSKGISKGELVDFRETLKALHPDKKRPIHGILPYKHLNYAQVIPNNTPTIAPAYKQSGAATNSSDTQSTPEAQISSDISTLAESLGWSPVSIYEWVKNNIQTEWYWGVMKGAEETLRQGSGNDADQAALLVALLRASNYPARFVKGVIEFYPDDISTVKELTGVEDVTRVGELFKRAGIPYQSVNGDTNYQVEHIWVETKIPYANYRGVLSDAHGEAWVPLDTSIKVFGYVDTYPVVDMMQEPDDLNQNPVFHNRDDYLATSQSDTPLGKLRTDTQNYLVTNYTVEGYQYSDLLGARTQNSESLKIIPGSLQFKEVAITQEYTQLPSSLFHTVSFNAALPDLTPVMDLNFNVLDVSNRKIVVSYEPESVVDQEIINLWGGLDNTPAYLVKIRPVFKLDDERIAVGTSGFWIGETYNLNVTLNSPNGAETVTNVIEAGYPHVIGLVAQKALVPDPASVPQIADALIHRETLNYTDAWYKSEDELSKLLQISLVRPIPSVVTFGGLLNVDAPLGIPQGVTWKGIYVDADLRAAEPVNRTIVNDDREVQFMKLSAVEGSKLESTTLEGLVGVDCLSTSELFGLANDASKSILSFDQTNSSEISNLPYPSNILNDLNAAVSNGQTVQILDSDMTIVEWTGTSYIKENLTTGEAGYMLSGSLAGSAPTQKPIVPALEYAYSGEPNTDPSAAFSIEKIEESDYQIGTVGETLSDKGSQKRKLAVVVRDEDGTPVENATVSFSVLAGGGLLIDSNQVPPVESTLVSITTDRRGIAEVDLRLGTNVYENQVTYKSSTDTYAHDAGENLVAAQLLDGSQAAINDYFISLALAGTGVQMNQIGQDRSEYVLTYSGDAGVVLIDQFGNPVANAEINFSMLPPVQNNPGSCDVNNFDQLKKDGLVTTDLDCINSKLGYGECSAAFTNLTCITMSDGSCVPGMILGSIPDASYPVQVTYTPPNQAPDLTTYIRHYTLSFGTCGQDLPSQALLVSFVDKPSARVAGSSFELQAKSHWIGEGASLGEEALICSPEPNLLCDQLLGNNQFDILGDSQLDQLNVKYSLDGSETPMSLVDISANIFGVQFTAPQQPGEYNLSVISDATRTVQEYNNTCSGCASSPQNQPIDISASQNQTFYSVQIDMPSVVVLPLDVDGKLSSDVPVSFNILPLSYSGAYAQMAIYKDGNLIGAKLADAATGNSTANLTQGSWFDQNANYSIKVVIDYGWPNAIWSDEIPLSFSYLYIEKVDPEYPEVKLTWNDYYPALGSKTITLVDGSGTFSSETAQCEVIDPELIDYFDCVSVQGDSLSDGEQEFLLSLKAGKDVFKLNALGNAEFIDKVNLKFSIPSQQIEVSASYNLKTNKSTFFDDVLAGRAVFTFDGTVNQWHQGVSDKNHKKLDYVEELLNQVVPRKRSITSYTYLPEKGYYDSNLEQKINVFKTEFNITDNPDGLIAKLEKDYSAVSSLTWTNKIIDSSLLVVDDHVYKENDVPIISGMDLLPNNAGLYELYINVVKAFVDRTLSEANKFAGSSVNSEWVSRTGNANHGPGMGYSYGSKDSIDAFTNAAKIMPPTDLSNYRGKLLEVNVNNVTSYVEDNSGTWKWVGLYKAEYNTYLPQFEGSFWAGIDCSGLVMRAIDAGRSTQGLDVIIPVGNPPWNTNSQTIFDPINGANPTRFVTVSADVDPYEQLKFIKSGDLIRYSGHISMVYIPPSTCNETLCNYKIIHAYGDSDEEYSPLDSTGNPQDEPQFSRKVLVTDQNIGLEPNGFGRITLWP